MAGVGLDYRVGIDVGGTYTDLVAAGVRDGRIAHAKAPSTPEDPSLGAMAGLGLLAGGLGLDLAGLLARTERIVHGTTVATNALLEGKGARVGLLTTEGHRDVLEMREGLKDGRYDLRRPPPVPLVERPLRLPVRERLRADGTVEVPLDRDSLDAAVAALAAAGVEAVAVCFLHSYRNPAHERAAGAAVAAALPGAYLSLSSEVLPQIKEFERVSTAVANAYVGPALAVYLGRLEVRLGAAGYAGPVLVVQSHGGVATVPEAVRLAAGAVLSGPAGGVAAARRAAALLGAGDLVAFDMGGTSTDVALVRGGEAGVAADRRPGGHRVALPSLDIHTLGAGGGSIARVDAGGVLHVGPESAGARPGPACYGRGGTLPTVTDANLVLGLLDPGTFLGGRAALDPDAAAAAVDRVAAGLGLAREAAAAGIRRVVNARMAEGVRLVSVRRGIDPRRFALLAFGGAAGLHATAVAGELGMARVVVPRLAAVFSAWGMLGADLRVELARTHLTVDAGAPDLPALRAALDGMEAEGRRRLAGAAFEGPVRVRRSADMRYGEQVFEVAVPLDGIDLAPGAPADAAARLAAAFHDRHEALHGYALRDRGAVLVNARVAVAGELPAPPEEPALPAGPDAAPAGTRRAFLGGRWRELPAFALERLAPGQALAGPAIVDSATTAVLLREGDRATATPRGWLDVAVAAGAGA